MFPTPEDLKALPSALIGREPWAAARRDVLHTLADSLRVPSPAPSQTRLVALTVLAGFISVADWIASDEQWFPHAGTTFSTAGRVESSSYLATARAHARRALVALGWLSWDAPVAPADFSAEFPQISHPRPLQLAAIGEAASLTDDPTLFIIEAPTGEGKTEAALHLAQALAARTGRNGFYLALPTQATSNQMFGRAVAFLRHGGGGDRAELQLLHGHASLSAEFDLLKRGESTVVEPAGVATDMSDSAAVSASAWFTHRKRGLLAPFGVGTIDQVLLAALQSRHVFVRLFGLSRRVVVIDEVHAYDTYMSTLLERLLQWLAALRSSVVLLSATLPSERRQALCRAYASGVTSAEPDTADATYPRLSRVRVCEAGVTSEVTHLATSPTSSRSVGIRWLGPDEDGQEVASALDAKLKNGGCAAVICNTVTRAQRLYDALRARWRETPEPPELELLHARFPFSDREVRERSVFRRFGPGGDRPRRAVLVATQVIEQSIDVDFEVMISDMAPIDLLLQRAGRLHRHARVRPQSCASPELLIVAPALQEGVPVFDTGTSHVYDMPRGPADVRHVAATGSRG